GLENLTIVTPSAWLKNYVEQSFLKDYPVKVIHNGIDTAVFTPDDNGLPQELRSTDKKIVLGVASVWDQRKGLQDFIELSKILDSKYKIVLVGLSKRQMKKIPDDILGISRTEDAHQLAALYSASEVFVNPTWIDNFPTTNIEALSCGTPVITYQTGGSPEAIDDETGFVVAQGDIQQLSKSVELASEKETGYYQKKCRERALKFFDKKERYHDYLNLYEEVRK
ncbi:MAG TPA: glycosyltransferase, partial [Chitinophagaceae bacterium]|nr:glycosyltransferase [Chitinophagaceae bacterium]